MGMMAYDHWGFHRKSGWIGQPKLICRIKIDYEDGTSKDVVSDLSWKVTGGPVVYDGPHLGEVYDATKEIDGWSEPGLDITKWESVNPAPNPGGALIFTTLSTHTCHQNIPPNKDGSKRELRPMV